MESEKDSQEMEDVFSTKLDVWRFLKEEGWKISRAQFYTHCQDGLLRPDRASGKYLLKAVEKYAKLNVRLVETGAKINDKMDKMQEEKLDLELAREKVRLERERHDLGVKQKKFIPREDFELAVVARAVALLAHLKHMVQVRVPDWIEITRGDQALAGELIEEITHDIEMRLADFARDVEFDVILESE